MSTHSDEEALAFSSQESSTGSSKAIMLGKFRLIAILGKGAMGKVVRAEDTKLKRHVAIKCLRRKSDSTA
jgi:serine/threonine protein kinase